MILKISCNKNIFYIEDGFNIISQCIDSDKYIHHTWKLNNNKFITCFGKSFGKEKYINKFEIPPPLDNILFYNDVYFVYTNSNDIKESNICKLNETIWNDIYEELFGGFETLDELSSDDDSDDSDDEYGHLEKTKEGYAKDGFIVDSEDDDSSYDDSSEYSSSEDSSSEDSSSEDSSSEEDDDK
jgi:hypothetical protein